MQFSKSPYLLDWLILFILSAEQVALAGSLKNLHLCVVAFFLCSIEY